MWENTPIELPGFKYTHTEATEVSPDYFRQELIYNGKSGEVLRFLYREYAGLELRPAFTQEVSYDLADGDVIGYKGSRFQVVGATNTEITYVPLQGFP